MKKLFYIFLLVLIAFACTKKDDTEITEIYLLDGQNRVRGQQLLYILFVFRMQIQAM